MKIILFSLLFFLLTIIFSIGGAETHTQIIFMGQDAATWQVAMPLIKTGALPTVQKLMQRGVSGTLETILPCVSPAVWTSIFTGKSPEKHGIGGFYQEVLVNSKSRKVKALWNILSEKNIESGFIGFWVTWPVDKISGFMISDRMNYKKLDQRVEPKELQTRADYYWDQPVEKQIGNLPYFTRSNLNHPEKWSTIRKSDLENLFNLYLKNDLRTLNLYRALAENFSGSLLAVYFRGLDIAEHYFWDALEPENFPKPPADEEIKLFSYLIPEYYRLYDDLAQEIFSKLDKNTIYILMSDHGMQARGSRPAEQGLASFPGLHDTAPAGMLVMGGSNLKENKCLRCYRICKPHVYDLTPTILHLLGLSIARDMDGRVLTEALEAKDSNNSNAWSATFSYIETYELNNNPAVKVESSEVDPQILEELRALGYIK